VKTLILGIGNELLADDGVGLRVARALAQTSLPPGVEAKETPFASLQILDLLVGYDRALLVDAIQTGTAQPGYMHILSPADLNNGLPPASMHHVDLSTVLALGGRLGAKMPATVRVFAVEAADVSTFGDGCSPEVEAAIPRVIEAVLAELGLATCTS